MSLEALYTLPPRISNYIDLESTNTSFSRCRETTSPLSERTPQKQQEQLKSSLQLF